MGPTNLYALKVGKLLNQLKITYFQAKLSPINVPTYVSTPNTYSTRRGNPLMYVNHESNYKIDTKYPKYK